MSPQFPALTLPNYWSMVTGVSVEKHGIVANNFYDPTYRRMFTKQHANYSNISLWSAYPPLWVNAEESGLKTSVSFWPDEDDLFFNPLSYNNDSFFWSNNLSLDEKIDSIIDKFIFEKYKFCVLYHNQPGMVSYRYGINSYRFNKTLEELDKSIGHLVNKLSERGLINAHNFNVLITSNYGNFESFF